MIFHENRLPAVAKFENCRLSLGGALRVNSVKKTSSKNNDFPFDLSEQSQRQTSVHT